MTQTEFIIPCTPEAESLDLYNDLEESDRGATKIKKSLPRLNRSYSMRPHLHLDDSKSDSMKHLYSPQFNYLKLKKHAMASLCSVVHSGVTHLRDPAGGSHEHLLVPILRLVDSLLLMGLLDDNDLQSLFKLIDPVTFAEAQENKRRGLLQMKLDDAVKLELVNLLTHLCDCQLRHRVEATVSFTDNYVRLCQEDQLQRWNDIREADLPPAIAAKKTREFRCPPMEQMRELMNFKNESTDVDIPGSPSPEHLRERLHKFHLQLLEHSGAPPKPGEPETEEAELSFKEKLMALIIRKKDEEKLEESKDKEPETVAETLEWSDSLQKLVSLTMMAWALEDFIQNQSLVKGMFHLLYRQYDGIGELERALQKTYVISSASQADINILMRALGNIRALLKVQVMKDEEYILIRSLRDMMANKAFFQHPDLMRILCVHETVMQLMINTLNKNKQQEEASATLTGPGTFTETDTETLAVEPSNSAEMVVMCSRFLCYFCRTSRVNQRAMFDHLSYLLDNSCMLLSRPSLRGSCPLDVAYSSLMDNNELALALRESHLEKIAGYLSRAGIQTNQDLLTRGYPDIGWDPVEGERFLDFLRFCVWVNGESVEENANLVVRLLIRRPECLGPALRDEGGGLLKAMKDGIRMSKEIAASRDESAAGFLKTISDSTDELENVDLLKSKFDFSRLPPEDDEDYIDIGGAILTFYAVLVDLLGCCAPDAETIKAGRSDSLRARAILRSLVSVEDLEGVLGLRFILPISPGGGGQGQGECLPPGLLPIHKSSIVLFLERVYGIPDQQTFLRLLEDGFLPDLRAATTLDTAAASESDIALALNRYLCGSVLPLLSKYSHFFMDADHAATLLDSTLHTVYRLSKCKTLTKGQTGLVTEFLVALTSQMRPRMVTKLLRKLTYDVPALSENTVVPLRVLTHHYERCGRFYGSVGSWGSKGSATEEEKKLTMMLFSGIFDSLAKRAYDPELFSRALPCLSAIGCALSPDYSLSNQDDQWNKLAIVDTDGTYNPRPIDTARISLPQHLESMIKKFAEHNHDSWAVQKIDQGWTFGNAYDDLMKTHPNLKPFLMLSYKDHHKLMEPIKVSLKAMLAWGWSLDYDQYRETRQSVKRRQSKRNADDVAHGYLPKPRDLRNLTLTREMQQMAERLAENTHDVWAQRKKEDLEAIGGGVHPQLVAYDVLTDKEKKGMRETNQELLKFLQMCGYRLQRHSKDSEADSGVGVSSSEKRFSFSLLEKLLEYVEKASLSIRTYRPSSRFSKQEMFQFAPEDVKFFSKVVLPLTEKYFSAHKAYFIATHANPQAGCGIASPKEKEMVASLFCKLAGLLRGKMKAFGYDVEIIVRCLQMLVQAVDARSVVKNSPEIVRSSILPFFNNAADDLAMIVHHLKTGRFSHVKGTITRGAKSLNYLHMLLLPVLTAIFDHLGNNSYGADLLIGDLQLACYKILNALYTLGTSRESFIQRHRPALGECVASFASAFPIAFLEPHLNKYNQHSMLYGITEDRIAEYSLEAQDIMHRLSENLPNLDKIVAQIEELAESGGNYNEAPHIIEVTLPMLCSYLPFWWSRGPDNVNLTEGNHATTVTAELMNGVLGNVLKLIKNNVGAPNAPWMNRIATRTQPIIANSTTEMLSEHILPVAKKLQENCRVVEGLENVFIAEKRNNQESASQSEEVVHEKLHILVRDIYAFYPLLIKYVDLHRSQWLKMPNPHTEQLYLCVADVFIYWSKSALFKREEHNFMNQNEIDNMALIMPSQSKGSSHAKMEGESEDVDKKDKKRKKRAEPYTSLNVACLKRLLPIGLNLFRGPEQEVVQDTKQKLIERIENESSEGTSLKESDGDIEEYIRNTLTLLESENLIVDEKKQWQKILYKKMSFAGVVGMALAREKLAQRIMGMARVLYGLYLIEHPPPSTKATWKKLISSQRKKAVMACFRMVPLHNLPRHKVVNLFLKSYRIQWLKTEEPFQYALIKDLTVQEEDAEPDKKDEDAVKPDGLKQLMTALSRSATTEQVALTGLTEDFLYMSYADIMSKSCSGEDEDDDDEGGEDATASFQEQEMEKQKLLFEQSRLADRSAAEMVLLFISACKGEMSDMVSCTIDLGISLLRGGNTDVQAKMLSHLREKKDVGFFTSVAGLMQNCSVLDLDAFERNNKAESLGVNPEESAGIKNLHDAEFTCKLFRFLQLLCEGHNLEFQNYLRTQAGNNTTVNVIICTVDYLLRLQESIMDFYWHYSGKDVIDVNGKDNFVRAINVAKQVFRTLTEYIQGPCAQNQLALAHSRLWDAVGGFLYIFAHMQEKLSKDPEQLELLREFMKLQKDMMIMLLSMLEGNVMNGPIGKQMVDTLVESAANVEMILKFFDIFLKMKDLTTSEAFLEFDKNKDGIISRKEFRQAMLSNKCSREEIDYIMMCVDTNQDGKVDFMEFTERFHNPAKDIGFNVAVLLTNLAEHMPNNPGLEKLLEKAKSVLDYFQPYLGRIEILGSSGRIERIYFEIKQSHIDQWEKPQIKESKRSFLHSVVNEGGDKEKLESFVNFCEDTIFEMQHANSISMEEQTAHMAQIQAMRTAAGIAGPEEPSLYQKAKDRMSEGKAMIWSVLSIFSWTNIKTGCRTIRAMTLTELILAVLKLTFWFGVATVKFTLKMAWMIILWIITMMMGEKDSPDSADDILPEPLALEHTETPTVQIEEPPEPNQDTIPETPGPTVVNDTEMTSESDGGLSESDGLQQTVPPAAPISRKLSTPKPTSAQPAQGRAALNTPVESNQVADSSATTESPGGQQDMKKSSDEEVPYEKKGNDYANMVMSWFARNFYNFKLVALGLAFAINFILLFYRVTNNLDASSSDVSPTKDAPSNETSADSGDDDADAEEWLTIANTGYYMEPLMVILALAHSMVAFFMLVAYYILKVPLVIFKREKEISRLLEFDGLWIVEQPSEEDIAAHWDKIVLSTRSFPDSYWDKFVKKKVRNKYSEQYDYDEISNLLGMEKGDSLKFEAETKKASLLPSFLSDIDWQYQIWKIVVIFTDNPFLYLVWYFLFSFLGNFNYFFFAAHLLDVAISFKTLRTILQSVTHNGKQLVLTVMLTSIVVYIYTVIAFNFFRKFYIKEEDGAKDFKCHDMKTCFIFHLYAGVRAGGGIGDEIESPDGDPYEAYRILFDITFFFFIIIILLAIIQGLIIDAFGELRDQLEQVKEDMESKCFICGIGKEYFDKVPHGFEQHVMNEHNFANYMFFLMHLINKPDTEYTGQETYVWELYQQRIWDFFPVGNCFRKQYEEGSE